VTEGEVEFRDVTFRYPGAQADMLRGVSFRVAPGERVAIVGRIGSGKTTLGRLLIGLYRPDEGAILIDGVDLRQMHPADVRRGVGLVLQDVALFAGTVRDNIALGLPHVDDAMILRAARLAGVDRIVNERPEGYALPVGERGQNLSGGQRQAIGLARALLLDPPILVLDEPTSAYDTTSEAHLIAQLDTALGPRRTLVLMTHRAAMLRLVERVIVLDGGRIVADGPRDEILRRMQMGGTSPRPVSVGAAAAPGGAA
jgi:ATP-binding cassette subfamily C protein LapB